MAEIKTLGPVGLNPLGDYNSETEYEKLDLVVYQGSSYVALQTVQGQVPTNAEYWQKLVSGGVSRDEVPLIFNTVAEMKTAEDLVVGDTIQTLGYYSVNDGGGATYKITSEESQTEYQENLNNGLYANLILDKGIINYKMLGAKLNGISDDTAKIIKCHEIANKNNLIVIQKEGTAYLPSASIDNCPVINTDCDFTGMKIKCDDNNDNQTIMIIADPNTLTSERNTIQNISLSSAQISSLSPTNTSPIPFLENYKNHYVVFETDMKVGTRSSGYGEDVYYSQGFEVNDLQQLTPNNMYADISTNATSVTMKYLPLNQKHLTIKLPEINIDGNVDNNPMILVMRNNIELLDCIITKTNFNNYTTWKQPLFRCRYCSNITIKNFVGENVSSEPSNTDITSYLIAIDKCFNVLYENNNLIKAHGCLVSYHTNFINFINNVCDRFDNHYGLFGNINITNNSFISYPSIVNLGYGDGQVNIDNCSFYKYDENGKSISGTCVDCRTDLTIMYAGDININNIYVKGINLTNEERYTTLFNFNAIKNVNSIFPSFGNYNFPNLNISNIKFENHNMLYRTAIVYNNNGDDVSYNLRNIIINNTQNRPYTSQFDFSKMNTTNSYIEFNNERSLITSNDKIVNVYLHNNNNFRSANNNTNLNCYIIGDNNTIQGSIKDLNNNGTNTISSSNISNVLNNNGKLNITSLTVNELNSNGNLDCEDLTLTEGFMSGKLTVKNLIVGSRLSITGCYVRVLNSVTNNGEIYLTGNYMYSSVAAKFNNGTINGNGNWAGANSTIINTL